MGEGEFSKSSKCKMWKYVNVISPTESSDVYVYDSKQFFC